MKKKGFTLIELLIVVAIIAILAAIAVPNFLEAQVRAKISRVKSDQRTLATAVESYMVDHNRPPFGYTEMTKRFSFVGDRLDNWLASQLTTPVSYMTSPPRDPFADKGSLANSNNLVMRPLYLYEAAPKEGLYYGTDTVIGTNWAILNQTGCLWWVRSKGPSRRNSKGGSAAADQAAPAAALLYQPTNWGYPDLFYDPTNGTVSYGWIVRSGRGIEPTK